MIIMWNINSEAVGGRWSRGGGKKCVYCFKPEKNGPGSQECKHYNVKPVTENQYYMNVICLGIWHVGFDLNTLHSDTPSSPLGSDHRYIYSEPPLQNCQLHDSLI